MGTPIEINGTFYPTSANTTPTHRAKYGSGGFRSVAEEVDKDAIQDDFKETGCLVYVYNSNDPFNTIYTWTGTAWVWFKLDGVNIANGAVDSLQIAPLAIQTTHIGLGVIITDQLATSVLAPYKDEDALLETFFTKGQVSASYMPIWDGLIPDANDDSGDAGYMSYDSTHLYLCVSGSPTPGSGLWGRVALDTSW